MIFCFKLLFLIKLFCIEDSVSIDNSFSLFIFLGVKVLISFTCTDNFLLVNFFIVHFVIFFLFECF